MGRARLTLLVIALGVQLVVGPWASADEVGDACDYVVRQLSNFKGGLYRSMPETFEDDGAIYKGCVVTVVGDFTRVPGKAPPTDRTYPQPGSQGAWDGGVPEPKSIQSTLFLITARCAKRR